jgi:hypothetical protein
LYGFTGAALPFTLADQPAIQSSLRIKVVPVLAQFTVAVATDVLVTVQDLDDEE